MSIFDKKIRSYSAAHGNTWAGTLDLHVVLIDDYKWLLDIKTGKTVNTKTYPKGYDNWRWQTAPYRKAIGADKNGVIHISTEDEQFLFVDLSNTYDQDLEFFLALRSAWYAHPDKISKLEKGHVPSVTEICGMLGFAPGGWVAVNAMRDKCYERIDLDKISATFDDGRHYVMLVDKVYNMIDEARKWGGRGKSAAAMATGKAIHEVIERWIRNGIEPSNSEPDNVVRAYLNFREWHDENVVETLGSEVVVYG